MAAANYCDRRKPVTCKRLTKYSRTNVDLLMSEKIVCPNCGTEIGCKEKQRKGSDVHSKPSTKKKGINNARKSGKTSVALEKKPLCTPITNSISKDMNDMTDAVYAAKLNKKTLKDIKLEQALIARRQMTKKLNFGRHQKVFKNLIPLDVDESIKYLKKNPKLLKKRDNGK